MVESSEFPVSNETSWYGLRMTLRPISGTRITFNAILFFHRINDNRMPVATQSHIHRFEKLVGKKGAQKRVLLITTMWDDIDLRIGASRELQLKTDYWQRFIEGGSSVCRFNRNHSSAWDILNPLLGVAKVEGVPIPAVFDSVFQEEMEEEAEMDAHQALTAMEQIYLDQQRLVEKLQDAILDPRGEQTEVLREVLAEERKVSEKIGSLLGRLKRQNLRWYVTCFIYTSSATTYTLGSDSTALMSLKRRGDIYERPCRVTQLWNLACRASIYVTILIVMLRASVARQPSKPYYDTSRMFSLHATIISSAARTTRRFGFNTHTYVLTTFYLNLQALDHVAGGPRPMRKPGLCFSYLELRPSQRRLKWF
jgi:hypothetical protein